MVVLDRKKNTIRNIGTGIINKIITIGFPFVLRTMIIYTLGKEYLGLSSLFTSILQVLSLSELGIGNAMVFGLYKPIADNDKEKIRSLVTLYKVVYRSIGCIIVILGLIILPFLPRLIHGTYPEDINIYLLFLIYLLNSVSTYLISAYRSTVISAHQRRDVFLSIGVVVHLLLYIVQIICLLKFKNYYMYVIWIPVFSIIETISLSQYAKKHYTDLLIPKEYSIQDLKELFSQVKDLFGHKLSNVVTNSVDTIVISAFLGLGLVTIYNNYYYLMSAISGVLDVLYTAVLAGIGNSLVTESSTKNENDFKVFVGVNSWIIGWCSICFLCLFQPMVSLWMGEDLLLEFDTVILLSIYFYIWKIRQGVLVYKDAAGIWHEDRWRPYVEIAANLSINILLVNIIGINGIVISTIISMALISLPWETQAFFNKCFHKSPREYYYSLSRIIAVTVVLGVVTYSICWIFGENSVYSLLLRLVVCIFVPNVLVLLFAKRNDAVSKVISQMILFIKCIKRDES